MTALKRAFAPDCERVLGIQIASFRPLLNKYRDEDTNPAAETAAQVRLRMEHPEIDHYFIQWDGSDIGYLRIRRMDETLCRLSSLCVLPDWQGRGCAQEAIRLAEALYPAARRWTLDTIKQEPKLRHLYEKMGYRLTGTEKPVKDGMDLVIYEKTSYPKPKGATPR